MAKIVYRSTWSLARRFLTVRTLEKCTILPKAETSSGDYAVALTDGWGRNTMPIVNIAD